MRKVWQLVGKSDQAAATYAQKAGVSPTLARLLLNRDIPADQAQDFLEADYAGISDPSALYNLDVAVERIIQAMEDSRPIVVYGDYDVDGMSAATLLSDALRTLGARVSVYIPSRLEEGYGIHTAALSDLKADNPLLITVDTGIAAAEVLNPFIQEGLDVVVTDHHVPPADLPDCPVVNPKLHPETTPFGHLCGAGVAFMLVRGVYRALGRSAAELAPYVALAALATVADIVPLVGDNRRIVKAGLAVLNKNPQPGIAALMTEANLAPGKLRAEHIAFQLAPRLNAAGRLDQTSLALDLLTAKDQVSAQQAAAALNQLNIERKSMEEEAFQEAVAQVTETRPKAVLVVGDSWHPGIIGIVASRLMERYAVPALVLTAKVSDPGVLTGSGRAPEGFNLYDHLQATADELVQYGGHAKAAGLSLLREKLPAFRAAFIRECEESADQWYGKDPLKVDGLLKPADIDEDLWADLDRLEPTGCGNPMPTFALMAAPSLKARACGKDDAHLQISVLAPQGDIRGIAFRRGKDLQQTTRGPQDILFTVNKSTFRGQDRLEMMVKDIRPAYMADGPLDDQLYLYGKDQLQERPYADIGEADTFYTKVAGVSFERRQSLLAKIQAPTPVDLVAEPDNPHDPNALAVVTEWGKIGYLNRDLAAALAPLIQAGRRYEALLTTITGSGDTLRGANLKISRVKQMEGRQPARQVDRPQGLAPAAIADRLLKGGQLHAKQAEALEALAAGKDVALIMGTGRGKSLVYQVQAAAKALNDGQMTVVFFPLKALLKDQFRYLQPAMAALGLAVYEAYGDLSGRRRVDLFGALADGRADIVLATPEFFFGNETVFRHGGKTIGFWVLDEAHHLADRRAGYRQLREALPQLGGQCLAMTATMSDHAAEACQAARSGITFIADASKRENLQVIDKRGLEKKNQYLFRLALSGEKTICYVNSRKQALDIAKKLRFYLPYQLRQTVGYYHGGLNKKARAWLQEAFQRGQIRLLIATTAFGEGIHLPDVRHVVVYHLCFSEEAFNQLAGRAGRDGAPAYVHLLYGERDQALNELILSRACPDRQVLGRLYQLIRRRLKEGPDPLRKDLLAGLGGEKIPYETLRLAKRIFTELGFLNRREADGRYALVTNAGKKALDQSPTYQEIAHERADYTQYLDLAFHRDAAVITAQVQAPILPHPAYFEGGGPDD
ncbi:single-stranded-DNA-specific exonuclease RecJ [Peptococcus simiae]|uniref:Single-stranded-DNA-specific exonuclease RecJ n=1 Tax=Peptococcus simiae TaxID=1643805 RepID=A0ABW9H0F9_9FIRM